MKERFAFTQKEDSKDLIYSIYYINITTSLNCMLKAVVKGLVILLLDIALWNRFIFPLFILKFQLCENAIVLAFFLLEIFVY